MARGSELCGAHKLVKALSVNLLDDRQWSPEIVT